MLPRWLAHTVATTWACWTCGGARERLGEIGLAGFRQGSAQKVAAVPAAVLNPIADAFGHSLSSLILSLLRM